MFLTTNEVIFRSTLNKGTIIQLFIKSVELIFIRKFHQQVTSVFFLLIIHFTLHWNANTLLVSIYINSYYIYIYNVYHVHDECKKKTKKSMIS